MILIVNYRTAELTTECLGSLAPEVQALPGTRAVVVDNNSQDGSVQKLQTALKENQWDEWLSVVALGKNFGFSGGVNRALRHAPPSSYILLLNSDTLVQPGCLRFCTNLMEREPDIGAMSCLVLNSDGSVQNVTRRFPRPVRLLASLLDLPRRLPRFFSWADLQDLGWDRRNELRDVDWLGGAFMLLRTALVSRIGLFDEDFFFYGEDVELCHRIWKAGYRRRYDPSVSITHHGGGSSKPDQIDRRMRTSRAWRARYLVQRKCYGRVAELAVRTCDLLVWAVRALGRPAKLGWDNRGSRDARETLALLLTWP